MRKHNKPCTRCIRLSFDFESLSFVLRGADCRRQGGEGRAWDKVSVRRSFQYLLYEDAHAFLRLSPPKIPKKHNQILLTSQRKVFETDVYLSNLRLRQPLRGVRRRCTLSSGSLRTS